MTPLRKPSPATPPAVSRAEAAFEVAPTPSPEPPVPHAVARAEEAFEASATDGPSALSDFSSVNPQTSGVSVALSRDQGAQQIDASALVCTLEPLYFYEAEPTSTPAANSDQSVTLLDAANGTCLIMGKLDPFDKNPAFVGTDVGIVSILSNLDEGLQATVPDTPLTAPIKGAVSLLDAASKGLATAVNFVCQEAKKEGTYYELLPGDKMIEEAGGFWQQMTLPQKAATVVLVVGTVVVLLAIPK